MASAAARSPFNPSAFVRADGAPSRFATRPLVAVTFLVDPEWGPALNSAIEQISNDVGTLLEAPHAWAREDALTRAARALGSFRAALRKVFPDGDPNYSAQ